MATNNGGHNQGRQDAMATTAKQAKQDTLTILTIPTWADTLKAWQDTDAADSLVRSGKGEAALRKLTIGRMALSLDAKHNGDAQEANVELRETLAGMAPTGDDGKPVFTWVKSRVSQARNLARGAMALATFGIDVSTDVPALTAASTLAASAGAERMRDAAKRVADALKADESETPDVAKHVREVTSALKAETTSAADALKVALEKAQEAVDVATWGDGLSTAETAALMALVSRVVATAQASLRSTKVAA